MTILRCLFCSIMYRYHFKHILVLCGPLYAVRCLLLSLVGFFLLTNEEKKYIKQHTNTKSLSFFFINIVTWVYFYNGVPFVALHLLRTLWIVSDDCSIASWQFIISRSQRVQFALPVSLRVCVLLLILFTSRRFFFRFIFLELIAYKMKTYAFRCRCTL